MAQAAIYSTAAASLGAIIGVAVVFGAFALFFIVAVSNRTDADPSGSRPMAAYLFSGAFLFLWIAYAGVVIAADSVIRAVGNHDYTFGGVTYPGPSYTNSLIRSCVLGGILVVFAGGAYVGHLRRGAALANGEADLSGPTRRIMRSYVALVSFITIVVCVLALMDAIWLVCGLISPTIFLASANHTDQVRSICSTLVLVVLAGGIFTFHQRFAPDHLRLFSTGSSGRHHAGAHEPSEDPSPPTT